MYEIKDTNNMAKKVTLKDGHTGEVEYPLTITEQVVDKSGKTVDAVIKEKFVEQDSSIEERHKLQEALINEKQLEIGAMEFDVVPTEGSGHGITSGGIHKALEEIKDTYGRYEENPEYIKVVLDANNRIIESVNRDGEITFGGINIDKSLEDLNKKIDTLDTYFEEVKFSLENGHFNGGGGDIVSEKYIRTEMLHANDEYLYIVTVPNTLKTTINIKDLSSTNQSTGSGFSFRSVDNIRIAFSRHSGENLQMENITEYERNAIKIYRCKSKSSEYDITLAAFDSPEYFKKKADYVTTDDNAELIIQSLWGCLQNCKVLLYPGTYNVYHKHQTIQAKQNSCFSTRETTILQQRNFISFHCFNGRNTDNPLFVETEELHNSWDSDDGIENSIFLCTRAKESKNTTDSYNTYVEIKDIRVNSYYYDKPLTVIDLIQAKNCRIEGVNLWGASKHPTRTYVPFDIIPNIDYVGIRVSHGSNGGVGDYIKHCTSVYYAKGFSICGEHFVIEDCLAHDCYIGFTFGDFVTRGSFEHPNIMIGCSIEGCYRLMLLTKNNIKEDCIFEEVKNPTDNIVQSTLICIGLSTEQVWKIPVSIREKEGQTDTTLPIYEVIKGAYRGRIEMDYGRYPFDKTSEVGESCVNFECKNYIYNNAVRGTTENRPKPWACIPGTQYYDTTINKLIFSTNENKWVDFEGNAV